MRKLFMVGAGVAALVYFLDPSKGSGRRSNMAGKLSKYGRQGASTAGTLAQQASSQATGAVRQRVSGQADNPNPDDNTLRDRVETELFGDPEVPKGDLNVFVVNGIVDLRGELPSQDMIDTVIQRAQNIEHVRGVRSYLHLPDTMAPNKEQAIEASEGAI